MHTLLVVHSAVQNGPGNLYVIIWLRASDAVYWWSGGLKHDESISHSVVK